MHKLSALLLAATAAASTATPAQAGSMIDIDDLKKLIKMGGTEIVYKDCKDKTFSGLYSYSKKKKVDRLTICKNIIDLKDADDHWEVLAHEATHIMQRCSGGTIIKEELHPRLFRKLQAHAPNLSGFLADHYRQADMMHEVEAFAMELQPPDRVKEMFTEICLDKKEKPTGEEPAEANPPADAKPPTDARPPAEA